MTPEELEAIKARAAACKVSHECAHQGYGCERCEMEAVLSAADIPSLVAEVERLWAENDRLRQDRYDALSVKTREGWLASEWIARTGKAERERDAARNEVERLRGIEAAARAYRVAVFNGGINAAEDELFAALDAAEGGE